MSKGCRALTDNEYKLVLAAMPNVRDRCLFIVGYRTGYRVSELLSVNIEDVIDSDYIKVRKGNTKGKHESRSLPLHAEAREAIESLIDKLGKESGPLFQSVNGNRLTRDMVSKIYTKAFKVVGLTGNLGTHVTRKSFSQNIYKNTGHNIMAVKSALGHSDLSTTTKYLNVNEEEINKAILK